MDEAPEMEAENTHSRHICHENQTSQRSAVDAKMPLPGTSTMRIRLRSVRQQMQKPSPTASTSAERISLPGVRQQKSRDQAKYHRHLQLQLRQ